jgi:uncharacterized protein (TIGR03437 family)
MQSPEEYVRAVNRRTMRHQESTARSCLAPPRSFWATWLRRGAWSFLILMQAITWDPALGGKGAQATSLLAAPLGFEPNLGQAEEGILYLARGSRYTVAFRERGPELYLPGQSESVLQIRFPGSLSTSRPSPVGLEERVANYFRDQERSQWVTGVPTYTSLLYRDLYPGIDLLWYGKGGVIEYDFLVAPGADPSTIAMEVTERGATSHGWLDEQGDLHLGPQKLDLVLRAPRIYQPLTSLAEGVVAEGGAGRELNDHARGPVRKIAGGYRILENGTIRFALGPYDPHLPLVIDPVLELASYVGGIGLDVAQVIKVDSAGNIYLAGETESLNFPTRASFSPTIGGTSDAFILKLNPTGTTILFSTFLGGRNPGDRIWDLQVDERGLIYVCGETNSLNFPVTENAAQRFFRGNTDAFLTVLTSDGQSLDYSTYLGGAFQDVAYGLVLEEGGAVVLTGRTQSNNFPVYRPLQAELRGRSDAFVTRISRQRGILFSTYLGGDREGVSGTGEEVGYSIARDPEGNLYLAGQTGSPSFPTVAALQPNFGGVEDGFLCKLDPTGETILYSTFLGSSRSDALRGLAVDGFGQVHVTGSTFFADFPTASPLQPVYGGNTDAILAKISASGDRLLFCTFLGGSGPENVGTLSSLVPSSALVIDRVGNLYFGGKTGSPDFPLRNPLQGELRGDSDGFVSIIDPAGSSLLFSTYFGSGFTGVNWVDERVLGLAVNPSGTIYLAGQVLQNDLTTRRALQPSYGGGVSDAFFAAISPGEATRLAPVSAASYLGGTLSPGSILAVFGEELAPMSELATQLPLPTAMQGTTAEVTDREGQSHPVPLFFVSPFQINLQLPSSVALGRAKLKIDNPLSRPGRAAEATLWVDRVAPAIFTANGDGSGVPSGFLLRITNDERVSYEPIAQLTPEGRWIPVPLDLGTEEDRCYLVLFGTGWRQGRGPASVLARIGSVELPVVFVGPQESFVGLDQLNLLLPRSLANSANLGPVRLILKAEGMLANLTEIRLGPATR